MLGPAISVGARPDAPDTTAKPSGDLGLIHAEDVAAPDVLAWSSAGCMLANWCCAGHVWAGRGVDRAEGDRGAESSGGDRDKLTSGDVVVAAGGTYTGELLS